MAVPPSHRDRGLRSRAPNEIRIAYLRGGPPDPSFDRGLGFVPTGGVNPMRWAIG